MKIRIVGLVCAITLVSNPMEVYGGINNNGNFIEMGIEGINNDVNRINKEIVAVIDTGVDPSQFDFKSIIMSSGDSHDDNGHGTITASIIDQVSNYGLDNSSISLLPIKVLDRNGNTNALKLAQSIRYAVDHHADVINLSLELYSYSEEVIAAVQYAEQKGVLIIAASGNNREGLLSFPATLNEVLCVGSADGSAVSNFSNYGPQLDVVAPESFYFRENGQETQYFGTSISSAEVTGLALIIKSIAPELTPDEIRALLRQNARDIEQEGWDNKSGNGMVNISEILQQNITGEQINNLMYRNFLNTMQRVFAEKSQFSRGEFIESVVYAMGLNRDPSKNTFKDVPINSDLSGALGAAYTQHLVVGYEDHTYRPDLNILNIEKESILLRVRDFYDNY